MEEKWPFLSKTLMSDDVRFLWTVYFQIFAAAAPIPNAFLFLGITSAYTPQERWQIACKGMLLATGILLCAALFGASILQIIGVGMHAFRIAGGIIISWIAWSLLYADENQSEKRKMLSHHGMVVTPVAFPILAGPGAISSTIIGQSEAVTFSQKIALYVAVLGIMVTFYLSLFIVCFFSKWLKPSLVQICIKLFGVMLLALGVQFILTGIFGFSRSMA